MRVRFQFGDIRKNHNIRHYILLDHSKSHRSLDVKTEYYQKLLVSNAYRNNNCDTP